MKPPGRFELAAGFLRIPLRQRFKHAAATRSLGESLWVVATSADGCRGFGEGCPRPYVSGETLESGAAFIRDHRGSMERQVSDLESLRAWTRRHRQAIDRNPAAWCAVELALLDLFGRRAGCSIENLLSLPAPGRRYRYTAVLGDGDRRSFAETLARYADAGFSDYKLKLSGDRCRDRERVDALRGTATSLRVDANNLWADADAAIRHINSLDMPLAGLEEPLKPAGRIEDLVRVADAVDAPIILDESVLRIGQLEALAGRPQRWLVNLRVSKMGGLLRSLDLLARGRVLGLRFIVGAQVGETSLLTRAALPVATAAGDALVGQEGAFGSRLLDSDPCSPELAFGPAGVLDTRRTLDRHAPGLGLAVEVPSR